VRPLSVGPLVLSLLFWSSSTDAEVRPPWVRGIALGCYSGLGRGKLDEKLTELKQIGASHVSLVVSWSTPDVRSSEIKPVVGVTTPDRLLELMIERAHAVGLSVFLFPILDVQKRKPLEWRGTLRPARWDDWWRGYERFILHYAAIARRTRAELLCVGSELVSTEKMRPRWRELVTRVRQAYDGKLVYSANWDHYAPVSFWDLVDVVGLTAYHRLSESKTARQEEMAATWRRIRDRLVTWSKKIGRPFLFTEVGYPSMDGCAVQPWDYTVNAPVDLEEQRRAIASFIESWDRVPQLAGVVFWDWYGDGGPKDKLYTPRGKPAAREIRSWFHRLRSAEGGGPRPLPTR